MITKSRIRKWLERGDGNSTQFMLVHRDSFSNDHWPTYANSKSELREQLNKIRGDSMHSVKEVYSYEVDIEEQLNSNIAWNVS